MSPPLGLRIGDIVGNCLLYLSGEVPEEVVFKYYGDSLQQLRINSGTVEYVIDIDAVAVQLTCEPRHGVFLGMTAQNGLDFVADVHDIKKMRGHGFPECPFKQKA